MSSISLLIFFKTQLLSILLPKISILILAIQGRQKETKF